jgi:DNA-binding XRE family transcriptional regulator/DNA polymerase III delta prime subunit
MSATHLESDSMANYLLRQAREEKGWTQRRLAEEVGVGEQTVRSWERGDRTPSLKMRNRLCHVLEKSPAQLGLQQTERVGVMEPLFQGTPPTHLPKNLNRIVSERTDVNRYRMLKRVRAIWIEGVLKHSLYQETLIALGLQEQPDALINPWKQEVQETNLPPRPFPPGTTIMDIYDDTDGNLLVLGAPGAGKTTLLLNLARQLLERAQYDEQHPIPVVFNLASWAEKRYLLEDWLVQELSIKYQVPRAVGKTWVGNDRLLLLLDGLDEVALEDRGACIDALNTYRSDHGLVPIVVCCRSAEYFSLRNRALLSRAVVVQPLTHSQIDAYLSNIGAPLLAMREALQHDPLLQEMASTPLMLNILTLTYHGLPSQKMLTADTLAERRRLVFQQYVERVLQRRGPVLRYQAQQAVSYLTWLAQQMSRRSQTEFRIERIQPDWLPDEQTQSKYRRMVVRIIFCLQILLSAMLYSWLRGSKVGNVNGVGFGLLGWLGSGPGDTILGWMAPGLGGGFQGAGSLTIIQALVTEVCILLIDASARTQYMLKAVWHGMKIGLRNGLAVGVVIGAITALVFGFSSGLVAGLARGFGVVFYGGLLAMLSSGLIAGFQYNRTQHPPQAHHKKKQRKLNYYLFVDFLLFGGCAGIGFGVVNTVQVGLSQTVVIYSTVVGCFYGILFSFGGGTQLIPDLGTAIKPSEDIDWSWSNAMSALAKSGKKGVIIACVIALCVTVALGGASSVFYGIGYGARYGSVFGIIIGLAGGVATMLVEVLGSGWTSSLLPEHQLFRPNEGIRRSCKNALFAASLFGPIGGLICGLICGLAFGVVGGLAGWPILGVAFILILSIIFAAQLLLFYGGIAVIEHYVLRWYLWRQKAIPWNFIRFLDFAAGRVLLRKVGGGYTFVHRLLLDYFAETLESRERCDEE